MKKDPFIVQRISSVLDAPTLQEKQAEWSMLKDILFEVMKLD